MALTGGGRDSSMALDGTSGGDWNSLAAFSFDG